MKLGCCIGTNIDKAAALKKHGYDYAELSVNEYANLEESKFSGGTDCQSFTGKIESLYKIWQKAIDFMNLVC